MVTAWKRPTTTQREGPLLATANSTTQSVTYPRQNNRSDRIRSRPPRSPGSSGHEATSKPFKIKSYTTKGMRRPSRYTQSRRLKREESRASDLSLPDSTEREFNKDFTKDVTKGNTPRSGE